MQNGNILLFGYGRYGEQVAKNLALEGYNIIVAEENKNALKNASDDGFENLYVLNIHNDAQLTDIIMDNRIEKVFCAFDDEEQNIYLTITLKSIFRQIEVIAICESKETERKLKLAGANKVIDTMVVAANRLFYVLEKPGVAEAMDQILFKDRSIIFKEIRVTQGSIFDGKNLKDIDFQTTYGVIVIGMVDKELGNRFVFVTRGINHKIDAGDILVVIGKRDDVAKLEQLMRAKA
ncbi:TrkA family potassium uptake protein [Nitratiruptor sp. YY09-18]|uniref:potassium channel family protein n=1 Tax=Nitratiruptor sp. YY09-18 TaxID=2724901 RepID=UPI001915C8E5|nr:TrkA family potassium uptake protein [Nitratiruptor sp. YY09-18]BCD68204.1 hypothetical protein NitYY0918_C1115 [Nitratiruptor sp. YY09-18]